MHHVRTAKFVFRHCVHTQPPLRHLPVGSPQAQKVALANTHSPHRHQDSSKPGGWAKPPSASDIHLANPPARAAIWPCEMDPCSMAIASRNCLNVSPSVPSKYHTAPGRPSWLPTAPRAPASHDARHT
eukprot:10416943-Heterocapsa_arctica.AAC.1